MATKLYELLEVEATATTEEIRKAYKKKALKTHPDRLPPTATEEEKKASEEKFRSVNQAYEILIDAEKRKEYDFHGTWPPPEVDEFPQASGSRMRPPQFDHDPFSHPFFHNHSAYRSFNFTDPFSLFDSIFRGFESRPTRGFDSWNDPFERFSRMERELDAELNGFTQFHSSSFCMFGGFPARGFLPQTQGVPSVSPPGGRGSSHAAWVSSESYSTQTINGVTQSVHTRRDASGNEHVTRTYPDGRTETFINGVAQQQGHISNGRSQQTGNRLPPPPPPQQAQSSYMSRSSSLDHYAPPATPPQAPQQYKTRRYDGQGDYKMNTHSLASRSPYPEHRRQDRRHSSSTWDSRHSGHSRPPSHHRLSPFEDPYRYSMGHHHRSHHERQHPTPPLHWQGR